MTYIHISVFIYTVEGVKGIFERHDNNKKKKESKRVRVSCSGSAQPLLNVLHLLEVVLPQVLGVLDDRRAYGALTVLPCRLLDSLQ